MTKVYVFCVGKKFCIVFICELILLAVFPPSMRYTATPLHTLLKNRDRRRDDRPRQWKLVTSLPHSGRRERWSKSKNVFCRSWRVLKTLPEKTTKIMTLGGFRAEFWKRGFWAAGHPTRGIKNREIWPVGREARGFWDGHLIRSICATPHKIS